MNGTIGLFFLGGFVLLLFIPCLLGFCLVVALETTDVLGYTSVWLYPHLNRRLDVWTLGTTVVLSKLVAFGSRHQFSKRCVTDDFGAVRLVSLGKFPMAMTKSVEEVA